MKTQQTNSKIIITGEVITQPIYDHTVLNEKFYLFKLKSRRLSGVEDHLEVTVSELMLKHIVVGNYIKITGDVRSFNLKQDPTIKRRLFIFIFAKEIEQLLEIPQTDINQVEVFGFSVRPVINRKTPFGREITDMLVASNRPYKKSDYIPVVVWGRYATYAKDTNVGDSVVVNGRLQSRTYTKVDPITHTTEERVAYELSASSMKILD